MRRLSLFVFAILVLVLSVSAEDVPRIISYQGKVTHMDGVGVNDTLPVEFRLYEDEIGGAAIWTENHPAVPIFKGLFDVFLGADTPLDLEFDAMYYLEIVIDGHTMAPRVTFSASPYSFRAIYADTAMFAHYADSSASGGGGILQNDVDVPLTSTSEFGIILGETEVHGALVDLDWAIRANRTDINDNETNILTHMGADHDLSPFNECVTWFHFDDLTDSLWIFDGAFPMATHIPNGPVAFDTLFTTDSLTGDTMLIMANFQVYGMLLADSIAAMGDFVHIYDSLIVHGSQWIEGDLYVDGNLFFGDSLSANAIGVDTLWSQEYDITDTIVNMANVKIHGELIADSIQAVLDTIWLDDNIYVDGSAIVVDSMGIGTETPSARLHVEGEPESYGEAVGYFQNNYVGTADGAAVYGVSVPEDYWGIGVRGEGGYIGTYGEVYPTGSDYYFGVYGYVDGSDGSNFGVYGDAYGDGENFGIYGYAGDNGFGASSNYGAYTEAYNGDENYGIYSQASGGSVNWAAYFADGNVNIDNDLYLYNGLYDGTTFGAAGQVLITDGSDVYWSDFTSPLALVDTLRSVSGSESDTIWTMAQFYVNGELIVDSIQAVGDTVFIDDNMLVDGNAIIVDSVGIGVALPTSRLHVEGEPGLWGEAVGYFQNNYVGTNDGAGVIAISVPEDFYGIGVFGQGGWIGVEGSVFPTGNNYYYGVSGAVGGSDGTNYALAGDAYGEGTNYGVYTEAYDNGSGFSVNYGGYFDAYDGIENYGIYATASGGAMNWAAYFADGNVNIDNDLYLYNGLYDGTTFGAAGQVLMTDGSDVYWSDFTSPLALVDTLRSVSGSESDTIWTMAQFYVNGELIVDSIQAVGDTVYINDHLFVDGAIETAGDVVLGDSAYLRGSDATGTDFFAIYDDGDTTRFESDNPIKIGDASLIVENGGNVGITGDLAVSGVITGDGSGLVNIDDNDWSISTAIGDGTNDTTLVTGGAWGIFRSGNVGYGNACSTHVNLGVACTTGASDEDCKYATVGGGWTNTASGQYSAIPGGHSNTAGGGYSFAAGRRAKANHTGAFVWADSTNANFASTGANQFLIRAGGGVGIGTTAPNSMLDINGSVSKPIVTATALNYVASISDYTILADASANTVTIDLPTAANCTGRIYVIKAIDITNTITIDGNGAETIDGSATITLGTANYAITIQSDGTQWWILSEKKTP